MKDKFYYKDGTTSSEYDDYKVLHRIDGPAIEMADGQKEWYVNGKCHRVDGPAIEWGNGDRFWLVDGKCHRIDGPAVERANGRKSWWIDEVEYSEGEFNKFIQEVKELPLALRLIDPREWVRKL